MLVRSTTTPAANVPTSEQSARRTESMRARCHRSRSHLHLTSRDSRVHLCPRVPAPQRSGIDVGLVHGGDDYVVGVSDRATGATITANLDIHEFTFKGTDSRTAQTVEAVKAFFKL